MENEVIYEEQPQKNGFLEFLRKIWSAKITLGITFAATALIVGIGLGTVVNSMRATYETEVVYKFPGAESGRYADGSTYNYMNNVSYANLLAAKETDPSFANIDIVSMSARGDISVKMVEEKADDGTAITTPAHLVYTAKQKYFSSYAQGRTVLDAVTEIPTAKASGIASQEQYDYSLNASKTALSYDSQVQYLSSQYSLINNGYTSILNNYGSSVTYVNKAGATTLVGETYLLFQNYFSTHSVGTLKEVLQNNGFVKNTDTSAKIEAEARIVEIDRIVVQNTAEINALTAKYEEIYKGGSTTGASPFAERIQTLITQNVALAQEKEYLEKTLEWLKGGQTPEELAQKEAFETLLAEITTGLTTFVGEYTVVQHDIQSKAIMTTYANSAHTVSKGAFAWYICAVAGVGAGLVLGLAVAYFKGVYNLEKKRAH